ncbi:fimbria/pilus periplasmic chaperone [Achromobacter marplatensis]|uniref:fimbria/pilus periplasmic chaperone n=1 Tax=Achromobacter marplatensis TaxID=470868 RepID=UPI0039F6A259
MTPFNLKSFASAALLCLFASQPAWAAVSLDRTRIIFSGQDKSVSLNISNQNDQLPYLAQAWIENDQDEKITGPLVVLPPLQRLEPGSRSQVKIQALPAAKQLPQDRESLFYFNLREVPPRSDQANSLQIALQTRVKLFYRPAALNASSGASAAPWQTGIRLMRQGDQYIVDNPTPYYVTLIDASKSTGGASIESFEPLMVAPRSQAPLNVSAGSLGDAPVLTYINDYGGRPKLEFRCTGQECTAKQVSN